MKTKTLFFLFCMIFIHNHQAFTYTISFAGTGISTTVDSVIVQNLNKKTTTVVASGLDLCLTDVTTGVENLNELNSDISISLTSGNGNYILKYYAPEMGSSSVYIYSINGNIVSEYTSNLQTGENSFEISAPKGIYVIKVSGNSYRYFKKFICQSTAGIIPKITFRNHNLRNDMIRTKTNNFVTMLFSPGDQLIYSGKSGNNCTLVADIPNADKTITFEFHECKDLNGKYYAVTKIGTQIWMAENLAYLPQSATADATIGAEDAGNSGKAFYYIKDLAKYGVLYNWFASQTAAPDGWHIPSNAEWNALTTYLGGNNVAAGKLKSTTNWNNPNSGTNESCFSATGGGYRDTGGIIYVGSYGYWWSSSQSGPYAWFIMLNNTSNGLNMYNDYTFVGRSIRCVMNQ